MAEEPEISSNPTPESMESPNDHGRIDATAALARQYQSLELLFAAVVSALIVLSLGLNLFLFKQMRLVRGQAFQQREVVGRAAREFHKSREPVLRNFVVSLQEFANRDPDFRPILDRYQPRLAKYFLPGLDPGVARTNALAP